MSPNQPISDDHIDALVRGYLEGEARSVDLQRNLAAIAERIASGQTTSPEVSASEHNHRRIILRWVARGAVAACLVVGLSVASFVAFRSEPASAFAIVSQAETALARPADRCYRVETHVPKAWIHNFPFLDSGTETLIWTRGDRFRVTSHHGVRQFTWGQDERQRVWVVCDPQRGIQFNRDEIPPMFARTRAYLGLDVRRLAGRFLRDFELHIEPGARSDNKDIVVVSASAKKDRQALPFNSARLEIERKSKIIRRMELRRIVDGKVRGNFAFTLVQSGVHPNTAYQLEHNLEPGGLILGPSQFASRKAAFDEVVEAARLK